MSTNDTSRQTDRVLRTIISNTNDVQGEWVNKRELYIHLVAHANMETAEVDQALHQLQEAGKIQVDNGEYRQAPEVERPKYRGEK